MLRYWQRPTFQMVSTPVTIQRLRNIVNLSVTTLFRQIGGGRVRCESEATLQLHLGRIIATAADLEMTSENETFSVELEKPLRSADGRRGRIDIWFKLRDNQGRDWRCAIELKFFKRENHREPNNRYDVFKDIARLESCADVADIGFMLEPDDITLHHILSFGGNWRIRAAGRLRAGNRCAATLLRQNALRPSGAGASAWRRPARSD